MLKGQVMALVLHCKRHPPCGKCGANYLTSKTEGAAPNAYKPHGPQTCHTCAFAPFCKLPFAASHDKQFPET